MGLSDVETKAECPRAVVELVARFAEHREAYQRQSYNETQTRREFIAQIERDKTELQRQIDATDGQIDRLVYELYGLTEDEIRIVEEATGK